MGNSNGSADNGDISGTIADRGLLTGQQYQRTGARKDYHVLQLYFISINGNIIYPFFYIPLYIFLASISTYFTENISSKIVFMMHLVNP